jgi:SnoaL-like domain
MEGKSHFRGYDGVREWWEDLLGIFPDVSIEVLEVCDLGDLMIAALHMWGHGVDSDAPIDETVWAAGEWRNGKLVWWQNCGSEAEALEAAGLQK